MMKKIELAKSVIRKYSHIFMCPLCGTTMRNESNSLVCSHRYCFDLSRYGYVHLLAKPAKQVKYDKTLFESRRAISRSGFFRPMIEEIREMIRKELAGTYARQIHLLDVGCGEGSHLADLVKELNSIGFEALGVGIDISKEGIRIASREDPGLIWCVADLAQPPFRDEQFVLILNLFSPANYSGVCPHAS